MKDKRKQPVGAPVTLCHRCRRETRDYIKIKRRGSREEILCAECQKQGL